MTVILTCGDGKTYSDLDAAVAALPASLGDNYTIEVYNKAGGHTSTGFDVNPTLNGFTVVIRGMEAGVTVNANATILIRVGLFENIKIVSSAAGNAFYAIGDDTVVNRLHLIASGNIGLRSISNNPLVKNSIIDAKQNILQNGRFFNNIFTSSTTGYTDIDYEALLVNESGSSTLRNNICYLPSVTGLATFVFDYTVTPDTYSNNIYYAPNATTMKWKVRSGSTYTDYASFASWASETNGANTDPLFVDGPNGDFNLTASSPAIDNGFDVTGLVDDDFNGYARPVNTTFDIGIYEYGAVGEGESGGGSPLLCWQLTGQYKNGRGFQITGPDKFPGLENLSIPSELINISVVEDGFRII